jgi:accessory gene regulator protein AgrB
LNYSFEAGVIKHFHLGVLMLILGFFLIEKFYKNKWALLAYSIILPLSYLESIIIFGIMLAYMFFYKKSNKKYLLIGFSIGCLFWLWVWIMSGSAILTSEYVYEKISEIVRLKLIHSMIFWGILC